MKHLIGHKTFLKTIKFKIMKKQTKSLCLNWKTSICMFLGLVMCLGVASCGGDDESVEPSKQNVPKRKKLVSIFTNYYYEYPLIEYDAYGRLSRIEETYKPFGSGDTYYYDFTYIGDTLKIFRRRSDNTHEFQGTYLLNAQGCLSKPLSYSYYDFYSDSDDVYVVTNMQYLFQYNSDGYLTAFDGKEDNSRKYVFSGDNLIRTVFKNDNNRTYLYSGDENRANIMFDDSMYGGSMEDFTFDNIIRNGIPTIMYNAGLLGKASKNLVSQSGTGYRCRFTYAFDSDGYPNYIEIDSYDSYGEKWWSRQFFLTYK